MQTLAVQTQAQPQTVMITPTATASRFIQNQVICQQNPSGSFQGNTHKHTHTQPDDAQQQCSKRMFLLAVLQPHVQSIMTSPQVQPMTIQHQRVLTSTGQTIQTLSTAPAAVHTVSQQVPVRHTSAEIVCILTAVYQTLFSHWLSGVVASASDPENRFFASDDTETGWNSSSLDSSEPQRYNNPDHTHTDHRPAGSCESTEH